MNLNFFEKFPILETERLILRECLDSDVDALFELYSDPDVAEFDWFLPHKTRVDSWQFIQSFKWLFTKKEEIIWAIARKEDDVLIGTCALGDFHQIEERCEIGYSLKKSEWNKGYITEVISKLVTFGFEKICLNRIEATVNPKNEASIRVLEKNHFLQEGFLRERDYIKGELTSTIVLAILKSDYWHRKNTVSLFS